MEQEKENNNNEEQLSAWQLIVGLILMIGLFIWIWNMISSETNREVNIATTQQEEKEYTDIDAYVEAQLILENFLKSPSTAEYPLASDANIKRYKDDAFEVSAYVDSQNSFGAMVRSDWKVMFQFEDDSVKPLAVVVNDEVLYKDDPDQ